MRKRLPIRTACNRLLRIQFRMVWLEALKASAACEAVSSSWSFISTAQKVAKNAKALRFAVRAARQGTGRSGVSSESLRESNSTLRRL
jgi:transposase-like protein